MVPMPRFYHLKVVFGENHDYGYKDVSPDSMEILLVNFAIDHKPMLLHLYSMINKRYSTNFALLQKYGVKNNTNI